MKTKCAAVGQPIALKIIQGKAFAYCPACDRALTKVDASKVGQVVPHHFVGTATWGK